jgi:KDO2-lipid IV(A) lauroyltransferase
LPQLPAAFFIHWAYMRLLFRLLGLLPLFLLHWFGAVVGGLAFLLSARERRRAAQNLAYAYPHGVPGGLAWQSALSSGRAMAELPYLWTRSADRVLAHIDHLEGWSEVEAAKERGEALVFLTPHIGCFEIAGQICGSRLPIVCLYRAPKSPTVESLMVAGRTRSGMMLAAADNAGVKKLLKSLRRGEAVGILPDQVPQNGEGIWVPYFGEPAYTMTLAARLTEFPKVRTFYIYALRRAFGRYRVVVRPPAMPMSGDLPARVLQINREIEAIVLAHPDQYFWSYNRYKAPNEAADASRQAIGQ